MGASPPYAQAGVIIPPDRGQIDRRSGREKAICGAEQSDVRHHRTDHARAQPALGKGPQAAAFGSRRTRGGRGFDAGAL